MKKHKHTKQLENIDTGEIYQSLSYFSDFIIKSGKSYITNKLRVTGACTFIGYTDEPLPIRYLGTDVVIEENTPIMIKRVFTNPAKNLPKKAVSRYVASTLKYKNNPEFRARHHTAVGKSQVKRYKNDPVFKLYRLTSSTVKQVFREQGFTKDSRASVYLGCSYEDFKAYIESKLEPWMTWDNHGEWELDHDIPISWARSKEEVIKLSHFTNMQPMSKEDNRNKSNNYGGTKDAQITREEYYLQNPLTT